ncbi:MAG: hypothetical protein H7838_05390 [Magnetococcus sp. DMHC-8]
MNNIHGYSILLLGDDTMKKGYATALVLALPVWAALPGWAADAVKGQQLHDPACMTDCHARRANGNANAIYTRKGHLESLEKLKSQVSFCNQQVLNTRWWPEDEADVVAYLQREFYKFK